MRELYTARHVTCMWPCTRCWHVHICDVRMCLVRAVRCLCRKLLHNVNMLSGSRCYGYTCSEAGINVSLGELTANGSSSGFLGKDFAQQFWLPWTLHLSSSTPCLSATIPCSPTAYSSTKVKLHMWMSSSLLQLTLKSIKSGTTKPCVPIS